MPAPPGSGEDAYASGFTRTVREFEWACAHGWAPTPRQLVVARAQALHVYTTVRGGKPIGGSSPEWLHGRAEALRVLLLRQASAD